MKKLSLMLALVVLLGVFAVACGEDEDDTIVVTPTAVATASATLGTAVTAGGSSINDFTFYNNNTFELKQYANTDTSKTTVVRSFSGSYTEVAADKKINFSAITKVTGDTNGFSSLEGWFMVYTGDAFASATGISSWSFNNGGNTATSVTFALK